MSSGYLVLINHIIMDKSLKSNPNYAKALEFMATTDLKSLPKGKSVIDGDNLWVNIVDALQKTPQQARYEVHDKYIDIQVPLEGAESFGVKPRSACKSPVGVMDPVKDILFFEDPILPEEIVTVQAGDSITFAPETAHAPQIGEAGTTVLKAIFKVRVI